MKEVDPRAYAMPGTVSGEPKPSLLTGVNSLIAASQQLSQFVLISDTTSFAIQIVHPGSNLVRYCVFQWPF